VLWPLLTDVNRDKDLEEAVRRLVYGDPRPTAVVSFPVVGEFFSVLYIKAENKERKLTDAAREFCRRLGSGDIETVNFGTKETNVFKNAHDLISEVSIDPTDAIIVASALEDTGCAALYTTDPGLIGNLSLTEMIRKMCEECGRKSFSIRPIN